MPPFNGSVIVSEVKWLWLVLMEVDVYVPDLQSSGDLFGEVDGSQENTRADVVNNVLSKVSDAPNMS